MVTSLLICNATSYLQGVHSDQIKITVTVIIFLFFTFFFIFFSQVLQTNCSIIKRDGGALTRRLFVTSAPPCYQFAIDTYYHAFNAFIVIIYFLKTK